MTAVSRLEGVHSGLGRKAPVRVATTASLAHSGLPVIDGVQTVAGDRILDKDNADATLRGIWVAASGNWQRAKDFDGKSDAATGTAVLVAEGTAGAGLEYYVTTTGPISIGATALAFSARSAGATAWADVTGKPWPLAEADVPALTKPNSAIASPLTLTSRYQYKFWPEMYRSGGGADWKAAVQEAVDRAAAEGAARGGAEIHFRDSFPVASGVVKIGASKLAFVGTGRQCGLHHTGASAFAALYLSGSAPGAASSILANVSVGQRDITLPTGGTWANGDLVYIENATGVSADARGQMNVIYAYNSATGATVLHDPMTFPIDIANAATVQKLASPMTDLVFSNLHFDGGLSSGAGRQGLQVEHGFKGCRFENIVGENYRQGTDEAIVLLEGYDLTLDHLRTVQCGLTSEAMKLSRLGAAKLDDIVAFYPENGGIGLSQCSGVEIGSLAVHKVAASGRANKWFGTCGVRAGQITIRGADTGLAMTSGSGWNQIGILYAPLCNSAYWSNGTLNLNNTIGQLYAPGSTTEIVCAATDTGLRIVDWRRAGGAVSIAAGTKPTIGMSVKPTVTAAKAANQVVATAVDAAVVFDTEIMDDAGVYNPATGEYTVPVDGEYEVFVRFRLSTAFANSASIKLAVDGALSANRYRTFDTAATVVEAVFVERFEAGKVLKPYFHHTSAADRTIIVADRQSLMVVRKIDG